MFIPGFPLDSYFDLSFSYRLGLSALGKLDNETVKIAARLDIPHHEGAGGIEDFADKESFQKHVKRVRNRKKRKRK